MTGRILKMTQNDEALRLLAQMYARWFMRTSVDSVLLEGYERIRDILYLATSQQDAHEQLSQLASDAMGDARKLYEQARDTVASVIKAGGSADILVVGETDGYRHLCLTCRRDEQNFQRVPFFQARERRWLLLSEVADERRSASSICQLCLQPITPNALVLFAFAGTNKHPHACGCGTCNRAGVTFLLMIYTCDQHTQLVLLPALRQIAAPSKQQYVDQAIKICRENGWYMLNKASARP